MFDHVASVDILRTGGQWIHESNVITEYRPVAGDEIVVYDAYGNVAVGIVDQLDLLNNVFYFAFEAPAYEVSS